MLDDLSSPSAAPDGPGKALEKMIAKSASQTLAYDLLIRIARRFVDAPAGERAAMTAEMEKAIRRRSRREKAERLK